MPHPFSYLPSQRGPRRRGRTLTERLSPAKRRRQNRQRGGDFFQERRRTSGEEHARADKSDHAHVENILRVDAQRIDNVLDLVGELIIGKSMLQQAFAEFARHAPKEALRGRFSDAMAFQARVLNDLQRSVMKIRMVPVEQLFRRFPRMVRDVARQCGKDVELVMHGQDTDLDKSLLDAIAEPLTHLVRNAISHGIESSEERVHRGNRARGTIHLTSYHHGNQVIVEIRDDGRGIDSKQSKPKPWKRQSSPKKKRTGWVKPRFLNSSSGQGSAPPTKSPKSLDAAWAWTSCKMFCIA